MKTRISHTLAQPASNLNVNVSPSLPRARIAERGPPPLIEHFIEARFIFHNNCAK